MDLRPAEPPELDALIDNETVASETSAGRFPLEVWRYEPAVA